MELEQKRLRYRDYFSWYEGNLDSLFNTPATQVNGLSLVKSTEISTKWNYFAATSRFFADSMISNQPDMPYEASILLRDLSEHWSVAGECFIVSSVEGVRAVRPDYVFPILNPYDRSIIDEYVIIYPKVDKRGNEGDSARVITHNVAKGVTYIANRDYRHGWIADFPLGAQIPSISIDWIRTNDGYYHDIEGIVREIIMRLNIMQITLNSVAIPILSIDIDALDSGEFQRGITPTIVGNRGKQGLGLTIQPPFEGETEARYIERSGTGLVETMDYVRLLLSQLAVITGIPDYIFGVNLSNPTQETERVLVAGQARVNRFRRAIERAFEAIGYAIAFQTEPFVTASERLASVITMIEAGIMTVEEARASLGYMDRQERFEAF